MAKRKTARRVKGSRQKHLLGSESSIAEGVLLNRIPSTNLEPRPIEAGTKVKIARVINTPIGHRLRLAHTTRWIARTDVQIEYSEDVVIDYTKHLSPNKGNANNLESQRKSGNKAQKTQKEFKVTAGSATTKVRRSHKVRRIERYAGMEKKQLRTLIESFAPDEKVSVTFLGKLAHLTGDYELVDTKTGRGKGGSKLMVLKPVGGGETITAGTPQSAEILHVVTTDGMVHGFESAGDVPRSFEMNARRGEELKAEMKNLVGTTGAQVRLDDTEGEFGGVWTVTQAVQKRGRYGQVAYTLMQGTTVKPFWSHRHSGIVPDDGFEVLSMPKQSTQEDTTDED